MEALGVIEDLSVMEVGPYAPAKGIVLGTIGFDVVVAQVLVGNGVE